ncbi:MAG: FliM/FliN family flagellar motor switch protein [Neomegalonema sp.]|nr:FliM/FliN family flagellar motor switch protein [Neomegalonema sp.]
MSALRNKIDAVRKVSAPVPRVSDVLSALTKHIEKEGRSYLGTVVEAMILEVECRVFSDVLDAISMPAMIGMIEVDGVERAALIDMELDLVYHVVDLRMGGLPSELPEFGARRPTSLDSEICGSLLNIVLEGLGLGLSEAYTTDDQISMRCTGFEHLPMLANIVTEKADVLFIQVSLDIGEAARSGNFNLVLPFSSLDLIKAQLQKSSNVNTAAANDAWASHMFDVVLESELDLTPVLHTTSYSVGELSSLRVGQVLKIENGAHENIELKLSGGGEAVEIANAKLGTLKDNKALKLTGDPNAEFLAPLRAILEQQSLEQGGIQ